LNESLFQIAKKIKAVSAIHSDIKFPEDFISLLSEDKLNA
jgi:hypothetical protein